MISLLDRLKTRKAALPPAPPPVPPPVDTVAAMRFLDLVGPFDVRDRVGPPRDSAPVDRPPPAGLEGP